MPPNAGQPGAWPPQNGQTGDWQQQAAYGQQAPPPAQGQPPAWPPAYTPGQDQSLWYAQPGYQQPPPPQSGSKLHQMKDRGGILGGIAAALIFLAKIGAPVLSVLAKFKVLLIFGKLLLTFGSMFLSMLAYSYTFGWPLAIGFVLSIFVHECGHAIAGKSRGLPISNMVFIPFMGAAVLLKRGGRTVGEDAYIGIMGPVFGFAYALICFGLFFATHMPLFLALAYMVALMNLFNLLPIAPLDGGWIVPVFSPKVLAIGALLMIPVAIWAHNPFIILLGLLSLPRIIGGWKTPPGESEYFKATSRDRWTYALAYPGIAAALTVTMSAAHGVARMMGVVI